MDDILASIRRILDEEGTRAAEPDGMLEPFTQPSAPTAGHPVAPMASASAEPVLELDSSMMLPEPDEVVSGPVPTPPPILAEAAAETIAAGREPHAMDAAHKAVPLPPAAPAIVPPASAASPLLVAPAAAAAAASSVGALMRTLANERTTATSRQGPTIEDLVREEMRPLLKEWLDTHLPPLVERLVRAEIERVVSRGP